MNHSSRTVKSSRATKVTFLLVILTCLGCIAGCGAYESAQQNLSFEMASQPVYYTDQRVLVYGPDVHIQPVNSVPGLKVLFVPFRVTQEIENSEQVGYALAKGFWQTWAGMGVFEHMEFMPDAGAFRSDRAVRLARSKGADMVVGGYVTRLLSGSTVAESSLSIQLEAYDVKSGHLVWSMIMSGSIPAPSKKDYIVFSTDTRMPQDPISTINTTLAMNLGGLMRHWSQSGE